MNQPAKKVSTAKRKPRRKKIIHRKSKINKSITEVVHGSAKGLYDAGLIDATTMHEFDVLCLTPIKKMMPSTLAVFHLKY